MVVVMVMDGGDVGGVEIMVMVSSDRSTTNGNLLIVKFLLNSIKHPDTLASKIV